MGEIKQVSRETDASLPHSLWRAEQIRQAEIALAAAAGISLYALMERAGGALEQHILQRWPGVRRVLICCGAGNNGGDGYVLARRLREKGLMVTVLATREPARLKGDAGRAAGSWLAAGGSVLGGDAPVPAPDLVIDAVLGTGVALPVEGDPARLIARINLWQQEGIPVLAVDLPSGLQADTGLVLGEVVQASETLTFIGLKPGLLTGAGPNWCGRLSLAPLGLAIDRWGAPVAQRIDYPALASQLAPRRRTAHKGDHGRVLLVGGNAGMQGAILLAARAALRAGAGLVRVCQHPSLPAPSLSQPELMQADPSELGPGWDSVRVIGPGLGQDEWARRCFAAALCQNESLVIDADGLNLLAQHPLHRDNWVLTPHPGEAARLLGCRVAEVEADRLAAVTALQQRYGGVVVLKGAGTLIHDGEQLRLCNEGNPGMASGGMGDLLSGIIAALLAQGLPAAQAAALGVALHGEAGDLAATEGERGMLASDLLPWVRRLVNPQISQER
ncbi:bifunctional ADP-dependent NAD(P)H-hydrate dehydratase/NAD(P)H-hydrate epimerase [Aeromonas simiae]|uniref:bifunctional ADP-dependent NAD(P)H-hydrate dehydratase/NAD(P)H-hydrate epimerase n=1 Tax=Aeromonas simiae TaxID=218936 RepID=UPI0005A60209|nr:bifunctional ADP-dependent NAD(P)H-hydrate dehydratase/NAD(P)H-hydrate epimerase [Aeromonas simiae]